MIKVFSTIRKKLFLFIFAAVAIVFCVIGLTACAPKDDDFYKQELAAEGWTIDVTFDYQGGKQDGYPKLNLFIKPGMPIPDPQNDGNSLKLPVRSGYSFSHYCVALKDDNGEFQRDADGNYVAGEEWDFSTVIPKDVESDEIVLLAQWWQNYSLVLHYGDNFSKEKTPAEIERTADGDLDSDSLLSSMFRMSGYTFLDYYWDKDKTNLIDPSVITNKSLTREMFEANGDNTLHIYGVSLEGTYVVLREPSDIANVAAGSLVYLYNDLDMSEYNRAVTLPSIFSGTFDGAGHKIKNLVVNNVLSTTDSTSKYFGLFNTLSAKAVIKDVTFENVSYNVTITNPRVQPTIGLLAGTAAEGATISNVHVSGKLEYELSAGYTNLDNVFIENFIGHNEAAKTTSGCTYDNVAITQVAIAYVDNGDDTDYYAVYVKYNSDGIVDVYGIATKSGSNSYSGVTIRSHSGSDGTYTLTSARETYTVTVAESDGSYTATVSVTSN